MNVKQIGGEHYGGHDFQHWDMVIACGTDYLAGVATKYLARWRDKGGVQDVQKAISYVDKLLLSTIEPEGNPEIVAQLMPRYVQVNKIGPREARASRLLFAWRNSDDLIEAKTIMHEIIQADVCTWESMAPLLNRIKPDGWQEYTFEGTKENRSWFRCIHCRMRFPVVVDQPPSLHHECGADPTRAYVAQ